MGNSPQKILWSGANTRPGWFFTPRSTLLAQLFCVFCDSFGHSAPLRSLGADRDTLRHESVSQRTVLLGTFTGITVTGLVMTFASAHALWGISVTHVILHRIWYFVPQAEDLLKNNSSLQPLCKTQSLVSTEIWSGSNKTFLMLKISKHAMLKEDFIHKQHQKLRFLVSIPQRAWYQDFPSLYLGDVPSQALGALMY